VVEKSYPERMNKKRRKRVRLEEATQTKGRRRRERGSREGFEF